MTADTIDAMANGTPTAPDNVTARPLQATGATRVSILSPAPFPMWVTDEMCKSEARATLHLDQDFRLVIKLNR